MITFWEIWLYSSLISLTGCSIVVLRNDKEEIERFKEVSGPCDHVFILLVFCLVPILSSIMALATIKDWIAELYNFIIDLF